MPADEKMKMRASIERDLETYDHIEKGGGVISVLLTLMLSLKDFGVTNTVENGIMIILLASVVSMIWIVTGEKKKYVYLRTLLQ